MIYLDVTSAAISRFHMGVHRTVRGVYHELGQRRPGEVTPLRWHARRKAYYRLSPQEQVVLNAGTDDPGTAAVTEARRMPFPFLGPEDVLLIPDLCWDHRIEFWPKLAQWPGRKLAVFHDAMPLNLPGQSNSNERLFQQYVCALGHLDAVICVSQEVAGDLRRYWERFGVPPKPILVLPWPVPFAKPRPENPPNQKPAHLIYVARLKIRKNHLILLEACERLWSRGLSFTLDLIGVADTFFDTARIVWEVRRMAWRGRPVRWRRYITDAELNEAYREASFTVFPSRMEGFGLPIIESLWHGRPVICGRNGAIGEVARGGGCLQVDQNDAGQVADAIERLLTDAALYDQLYREATARTFLFWPDYGEQLERVLFHPDLTALAQSQLHGG